jgi:hypothetical protein
MTSLAGWETDDLKLIYRVLHAHLMEHAELLDSPLFTALQTHLQAEARKDGVDLTDHAQWDGWLGNPSTPCDERMKQRRPLKPV